MSKRQTEAFFSDLLGVQISLGSLCSLQTQMSQGLKAPVEEPRSVLPQEPVVHMDETGWRQKMKSVCLWVATTFQMTVFLIQPRRGTQEAKALVGTAFSGTLISDR